MSFMGSERQAWESALHIWAIMHGGRDKVVRSAYAAGVSKNRIHTITHIARSTINRILVDPMAKTIVRIDDNTRGKVVCTECGLETYVYLLGDLDEVIAGLTETAKHKCP
jgi:DNA-binding transcriptional regulator LsrR (DeoR family)